MMTIYVDDIFRCPHPLQDISAQKHRHDREHHCKDHRYPCTVGYTAAHSALVLCSKPLRNRNRKTAADSHTEPDNQKVDRAGGAYRRQLIHAQKLSNDRSIHQTVKLLE